MLHIRKILTFLVCMSFCSALAQAQEEVLDFYQLSKIGQVFYNNSAPVDYTHIPPSYMPFAEIWETYPGEKPALIRLSVAPRDGTVGTMPVKRGMYLRVEYFGSSDLHVFPIEDPVSFSRQFLNCDWDLPSGYASAKELAEKVLKRHQTLSQRVMSSYPTRFFYPKTKAAKARFERVRGAFYDYAYYSENFYELWIKRHYLDSGGKLLMQNILDWMHETKTDLRRELKEAKKTAKTNPKGSLKGGMIGGAGAAVGVVAAMRFLESGLENYIEKDYREQIAREMAQESARQIASREQDLEDLKKEPRLAAQMLKENPQAVREAVETDGPHQPALAAALEQFGAFFLQSETPGTEPFRLVARKAAE